MISLTIGVLLWSVLHFLPAFPTGLRQTMVVRLGEGGWKALFTVLMLAAVALMILGWKAAPRTYAFTPPQWGDTLNLVCMITASVLLFTSMLENNLRRIVRHPMLLAVVLWGVGHVIATGQVRALILFGGLALWAVVEILLLNRRDGPRDRPAKVSPSRDIVLLLLGAGVYMIFAFTHQALFGVSPIPT